MKSTIKLFYLRKLHQNRFQRFNVDSKLVISYKLLQEMQTKDLQGLLTTNSAESSYELARQLEIDLSAIVLRFKWYKKNARK